jgi:O-antigen ligase
VLVVIFLSVFWLAITVALSTYFTFSIKYFFAKTWYLLAFLATPLILWKDETVFKRSVAVLFSSMLLATVVVLFKHAHWGFRFAQINEAVMPFFRNHVNYSALLVFMIPVQVFLWQSATKRSHRVLMLLTFFITLPALYFSFARGAWLALITGMAVYWLIRKKWLFRSFVFVVASLFLLTLWLKSNDRYLNFAHDYQTTFFHENFQEHLAATYQLKDVSTAERFHRWIAGVRMAEDSWQTGFGPTTFYQHYKSYTVPAFKTWVSRNEEKSTVHNYFLLLLVEQGVIGLLLFLLLLGMLFWYAQKIYHRHTATLFWKRTVAAIAVILVMQCTVNFLSDLIETDKAGSVFLLCIAALLIADKNTRKAGGDKALNRLPERTRE